MDGMLDMQPKSDSTDNIFLQTERNILLYCTVWDKRGFLNRAKYFNWKYRNTCLNGWASILLDRPYPALLDHIPQYTLFRPNGHQFLPRATGYISSNYAGKINTQHWLQCDCDVVFIYVRLFHLDKKINQTSRLNLSLMRHSRHSGCTWVAKLKWNRLVDI